MNYKEKSLEELMEMLEKITEELNDENVSFEKSVTLYKEGSEIYKYCEKILENLKADIKKIEDDYTEVDFLEEVAEDGSI